MLPHCWCSVEREFVSTWDGRWNLIYTFHINFDAIAGICLLSCFGKVAWVNRLRFCRTCPVPSLSVKSCGAVCSMLRGSTDCINWQHLSKAVNSLRIKNSAYVSKQCLATQAWIPKVLTGSNGISLVWFKWAESIDLLINLHEIWPYLVLV